MISSLCRCGMSMVNYNRKLTRYDDIIPRATYTLRARYTPVNASLTYTYNNGKYDDLPLWLPYSLWQHSFVTNNRSVRPFEQPKIRSDAVDNDVAPRRDAPSANR